MPLADDTGKLPFFLTSRTVYSYMSPAGDAERDSSPPVDNGGGVAGVAFE